MHSVDVTVIVIVIVITIVRITALFYCYCGGEYSKDVDSSAFEPVRNADIWNFERLQSLTRLA